MQLMLAWYNDSLKAAVYHLFVMVIILDFEKADDLFPPNVSLQNYSSSEWNLGSFHNVVGVLSREFLFRYLSKGGL